MGEDLAGAGVGSGVIQCGGKCVDSGSDCLGSDLGFAPHSSVIWGKNLNLISLGLNFLLCKMGIA